MLLAFGERTASSSPESSNLVFTWPRPLHQPHVLHCNHLSLLFCKRLKIENRKNVRLHITVSGVVLLWWWIFSEVAKKSDEPRQQFGSYPSHRVDITLNQDHELRQPIPRCMLRSWVWWRLINHNAHQIQTCTQSLLCMHCDLWVGFSEFAVHQGKDERKTWSHFSSLLPKCLCASQIAIPYSFARINKWRLGTSLCQIYQTPLDGARLCSQFFTGPIFTF